MEHNEVMQVLDGLYEKVSYGIPRVSQPVQELAEEYLKKAEDTESAARKFIGYQVAKCTTSGFLSGLGGMITLPVSIPANVSSVLYVQMRMIACIAYMGGYDINCDQVRTLVYACLAGVSVDQVIKQAGIKFGTRFTTAMVKKIPGSVLTKINQKVGFRFVTKFGTTGVVNLGKVIPVVGGIVGGCVDFAETRIIADRAYKLFIRGEVYAWDTDSSVV